MKTKFHPNPHSFIGITKATACGWKELLIPHPLHSPMGWGGGTSSTALNKTWVKCRNFRSIEWHQKHTSKSRETIPLKRILKQHPFSNDPIRSKTYEIILFRVSYNYVRDELFVFERNFSDKKTPKLNIFWKKSFLSDENGQFLLYATGIS
jgi:hypothetical protein